MSKLKETLYNKIINDRISDNINLDSSNKIKYIIIVIGFLVVSFFFVFKINNKDNDSSIHKLQPGMLWEDPPLIAEFTFPIYKNYEEYISERNSESEKALPIFVLDNSIKQTAISNINNILNTIRDTPELISEVGLSDKDISSLINLPKSQRDIIISNLRNFLVNYIENVYNNGYVNVAIDKLAKNEILIQVGANRRYILQTERIVDKTIFMEELQDKAKKVFKPDLQNIIISIISRINYPNLIFSKELTDKNVIQSMESVARTIGIVRAGEIIIKNGDKLTESSIQKILSYQSSKFMINDTKYGILYYIGNIGQAAMIFTILIVYLLILRKRISSDPVQLIIIMLQLIIISAISWVSGNFITSYPTEYFIVVPSFAMLSTIVFDSRTSFVMTVTMGLLVSGIRNNDYTLGLIMIFSGAISSYTVRDIQNRTQVYKSMFFIFLTYLASIFIFSSDSSFTWDKFGLNVVLAFVGALLSPIITFGILFLIERLTNIASDLRIQEYDSLDHPLLIKLSELAPGTFQHTMSVALLAERCAREIDANPLLTKVATYYHDIGKIMKPEYFTENQIGIGNKHDFLAPINSAKIIIEHVSEGIRLANQYKLPQRIIDFIATHHGTTLVKHFYAKALEEVNENGVDENDFRYPGPKPNSKETAILMICDSAEAISRVESKSLVEIEDIIDKNIKDRTNDGQFNECDITMQELEIIKRTIARTLISMSHKRVNYKEIPREK